MKYGDFTLGQVEAVINKLGGETGALEFLGGKLEVVRVKPKKHTVLMYDGRLSAVEITERFNPQEFYRTRAGLYVDEDFVKGIVAVAKPVEAGRKFNKATCWRSKEYSGAANFKKEHPTGTWNATDFCAWLSVKLIQQQNGEKGELGTRLREFPSRVEENLFLVRGNWHKLFMIEVSWCPSDCTWYLCPWDVFVGRDAGSRFISRPTAP